MVKITKVGEDELANPIFEAVDLATGNPVICKNWFEKSKDKWHIVLGENSANRKYIAHNEFTAKAVDGVYTVEDKTSGPRVLGTAQPDKALVPYMTEEDKAEYDRIIAAAIVNRDSQKAVPMTEEEKLEAQIAKLRAKLAAKQMTTTTTEGIPTKKSKKQ